MRSQVIRLLLFGVRLQLHDGKVREYGHTLLENCWYVFAITSKVEQVQRINYILTSLRTYDIKGLSRDFFDSQSTFATPE